MIQGDDNMLHQKLVEPSEGKSYQLPGDMTSTTMSEWNYHFEVIPETLTEPFTKIFTNYEEGLVRSQPGGFVFTPLFGRNAEKIYSLKPRKDDVWLLSFPKCGRLQYII